MQNPNQTTTTPTMERPVMGVVEAQQTLEGAGFPVRRPFPTNALPMVDPFLMIDHLGPKDWAPGEALGAPDHPHRGFETVTYVLQGRNQHKDSVGNAGQLGPGDVQWMTAGSGVVHSEEPEEEFRKQGGIMHGFQIWVNLPASHKMMAPRYQELPSNSIPSAQNADGDVEVKVIAGSALGVEAVIETITPIMLMHFTLRGEGEILQPVPPGHNAIAYVFSGAARIGPEGQRVPEGHLAVFEEGAGFAEGEGVRLSGPGGDHVGELLLLTGAPINEPVARHGPFVMNTREEIIQAFNDYQEGRMGQIEV